MATGATASSGTWVPTLAVYHNSTNTTQKHPTQKRQGTWVPVPGCLQLPWLFTYCNEQGEGGGARGPASGRGGTPRLPQSRDQVYQRKGRSMPRSLGNSWERCRAKYQALRTDQVLHLRRCNGIRAVRK